MVHERLRRVLTSRHGFTMTEIVVVVAVIGIIMAVSIPMLWTYFRSATVRGAAEEAVNVLAGARQLAIRLNTTVCVTNNTTTAQYHVSTCTATAWKGPGTDSNGNIILSNSMRFGGTSNICFNYLGAGASTPAPCVASGTVTVSSPTSGGGSMNVTVSSTGRVKIQ